MMKKLFTLFILISVCAILVPYYSVATTNKQQEPKKEKVKIIFVSGIVSDEQGNRLKGVIIMVVRESESDILFGLESGEDGKYKIRTESNRTLTFSLDGYESQKISIKGRDEIDVLLKKKSKPNLTD